MQSAKITFTNENQRAYDFPKNENFCFLNENEINFLHMSDAVESDFWKQSIILTTKSWAGHHGRGDSQSH